MINPLQTVQAQFRHRLRFVQQILSPPAIAVVGAYHYENVGDMALAAVGRAHWPGPVQPALQTSANIAKWPGQPITLVCGGAIITEDFIVQLRHRFGQNPERLGLIGMELARSPNPLTHDSVAFLASLPFVAFRNSDQISLFSDYGLPGAPRLIPDIVFAAPFASKQPRQSADTSISPHPLQSATGPQVLGVNVTAGTGRDRDLSRTERATIRDVKRTFFRAAVEDALGRGWQVEHVPFAISDDNAAREVLDGLSVRFAPFTSDPTKVFAHIARMSAFAPSRYHALIFAILAGLPVTPFLYARKNYWLAADFLPGLEPFGFREALDDPSPDKIRRHAGQFWSLSAARGAELRTEVKDAFRDAFDAISQTDVSAA